MFCQRDIAGFLKPRRVIDNFDASSSRRSGRRCQQAFVSENYVALAGGIERMVKVFEFTLGLWVYRRLEE